MEGNFITQHFPSSSSCSRSRDFTQERAIFPSAIEMGLLNSNISTTQLRCLCLVAVFFISSCELSEVDIPDQGKILGIELSKARVQKIIAYFGIPYAQPPLGILRFAPPVTNPLPDWKDVRNYSSYLPGCVQVKEDYKDSELPFLQLLTDEQLPTVVSEDCLYLNIFVPNGKSIFSYILQYKSVY